VARQSDALPLVTKKPEYGATFLIHRALLRRGASIDRIAGREAGRILMTKIPASSQMTGGPVRRAAIPASPAPSSRTVIERIYPELDGGRYPIKRVVGNQLDVWADIYRDGHDVLRATLLYRRHDSVKWSVVPMRLFGNDRWTGTIALT
jgi:hypothetical protein